MSDPPAKYLVLVPLQYNNGDPVSPETILDFKEELFLLAGGYSIPDGTVEGAYKMNDGKKQIDHSLQFWVVLPKSQYAELESVVVQLGKKLGQESMYLEEIHSAVRFVSCLPVDSEKVKS